MNGYFGTLKASQRRFTKTFASSTLHYTSPVVFGGCGVFPNRPLVLNHCYGIRSGKKDVKAYSNEARFFSSESPPGKPSTPRQPIKILEERGGFEGEKPTLTTEQLLNRESIPGNNRPSTVSKFAQEAGILSVVIFLAVMYFFWV